MISKNELSIYEDFKCVYNLKEKYFKAINKDLLHKTKRTIGNEAGEMIIYCDIADDTLKNKRYEVSVKENNAEYWDLAKDNLPADFIYSVKPSEVRFVS